MSKWLGEAVMHKLHKHFTVVAICILAGSGAITHTAEKVVDRVFDSIWPLQQVAGDTTYDYSIPDFGGVYAEPKAAPYGSADIFPNKKLDYYETATPPAKGEYFSTYSPKK